MKTLEKIDSFLVVVFLYTYLTEIEFLAVFAFQVGPKSSWVRKPKIISIEVKSKLNQILVLFGSLLHVFISGGILGRLNTGKQLESFSLLCQCV